MSYGDGVITKERGKYRVRIPIGGGKYRTVASGVESYEEARQILNAARIERTEVGDGVTLRRLGVAWLEAIGDQRSWKQVHCSWHSIVLDGAIADMPIDAMEPSDVQRWADTLPNKRKKRSVLRGGKRETIELNEPLSHKSAANALGYVRLCLRWGVKHGRCKRNPAEGVELSPDRKRVEEPLSYLSAEQVETLLRFDALTLEQRTVYTLAIFQCPREGELAGMDWERIEWADHGWWIARSWNGPTKNGRARWQALIDRSYDALRLWWEHSGKSSRGIVFPSPQPDDHGQPKRYARGHDWGWADHHDRNLCRLGMWRRAGLRRVRFHDLRDTGATHLLSGTWAEPWTLSTVSKHLGHASTAVTEARYAHTTRDALKRAAASVRFPTPAARPAAAAIDASAQALEIAGSGGRDRTYGQSVNRNRAALDLRAVAGGAAASWQDCAEALSADLLALLLTDGASVPAATLDALQAALAQLGGRLLELAARMAPGNPHRLDVAIEAALLIAKLRALAPTRTGAA